VVTVVLEAPVVPVEVQRVQSSALAVPVVLEAPEDLQQAAEWRD
jgi:hypothetical protein